MQNAKIVIHAAQVNFARNNVNYHTYVDLSTKTSEREQKPSNRLLCQFTCIITARRSYASAVLGVVILSVCPSDTRVLCDKTRQCTANILTRKGNHSSFLTPTLVGGRRPLTSEICAHGDPPPSKNARLR